MKIKEKVKTIIIDDERQWQIIIKKLAENIPELLVEGVFSDIETAQDFLIENNIDLIFLDMQINDDNGIEFIKQLDKKYAVIIISVHTSYALAGYSISAIDYLTKPIEIEKFEQAVYKAINQIRLLDNTSTGRKIGYFDEDYFLIKEDNGVSKINFKEVMCIMALENYIKIITEHKTYLVLTTLLQFERSINNHPFLHIHRSYIVNLNYIKTIVKDNCVLNNDQSIPIGDYYKNDINTVFIQGKNDKTHINYPPSVVNKYFQ